MLQQRKEYKKYIFGINMCFFFKGTLNIVIKKFHWKDRNSSKINSKNQDTGNWEMEPRTWREGMIAFQMVNGKNVVCSWTRKIIDTTECLSRREVAAEK